MGYTYNVQPILTFNNVTFLQRNLVSYLCSCDFFEPILFLQYLYDKPTPAINAITPAGMPYIYLKISFVKTFRPEASTLSNISGFFIIIKPITNKAIIPNTGFILDLYKPVSSSSLFETTSFFFNSANSNSGFLLKSGQFTSRFG